MSLKKIGAYLFLVLISFLLGIFSARYQFFPYPQLKSVKQFFFPPIYRDVQTEYHKRYYDRKLSVHRLMSGMSFDATFAGDSLIDELDLSVLFSDLKLANFGINADTSSGLLARLETIKVVETQKIFILVGINDLFQGVGIESILGNFEEIIRLLRSNENTVYFISLLPLGKKHQDFNKLVDELNEKIKKLSAINERVQYIDTHSSFALKQTINPIFTNDDLHLNALGYQQLKLIIKPHLYKP